MPRFLHLIRTRFPQRKDRADYCARVTRPDPTVQLQTLRAGRPVAVPARRARVVLAPLAALLFTILGLFMIGIALSQFDEVGPLVLLSKPFVAGTLAVLVFGVWMLPVGIRALSRRQRLLLDTDGFAQEVRKAGRWEQTSRLAWIDIEEFTVQRIGALKLYRGTKLVCYRLTEAADARRLKPAGRISRWATKADANVLGPRTVGMSHIFGPADSLHELLSSAHREYGRPPTG